MTPAETRVANWMQAMRRCMTNSPADLQHSLDDFKAMARSIGMVDGSEPAPCEHQWVTKYPKDGSGGFFIVCEKCGVDSSGKQSSDVGPSRPHAPRRK